MAAFHKKNTNVLKLKTLVLGATMAVVAWVAAANSMGVQARYEDDITEYAALVAGDSLPVQARMERAQRQLAAISLAQRPEKPEAEVKGAAKSDSDALLDKLIATAYKYLGVRYRRGHSGPDGFDCSGFTSFVFRQHDIQLTHSSRTQYTEGERIADVKELQRGDLVFFGGSSRSAKTIGHVGIVTEVDPATRSFKFIHASTSRGIKVDSSQDPYYTRRYVGACRVVQ